MLRTTGWVSVMTGLASGTLWLNGGASRAPLPAQAAPSMALAEGVSGYPLERSACLAIKVGAAAATECGDLRVSHALPGVRVFNSDVTPTLTYNSEHAHPHLSVPLHITQLSTTTTPDFVEVQIFAGPAPNPTTLKATKTWPGSEWPSGQTTTRRITMSYDAINDTTGMYFYRVKIANLYGATRIESLGAITGTRNLVNRSQSPFGAGWWLSGLEQVKKTWTPAGFNQQRLWIGGDGSTRIFIDGYNNAYDRLDSLKKNVAGTVFTRDMPEGRRMEFNSVGQHTKTINRFGRITTFTYSSGRLSSITLPAPTSKTFTFAYGNPNTKLSTITSPPLGATARVTTVTMPANRITAIKNPGDSSVTFGYLTGTSDSHLMNSRTDRRGTATTFTYDAAYKFRSSTVNPSFGGASIVWTVHAGESRGAAGSGTPNSLDTLQNATKIEGPRTVADNTEIFQERFGSPRKSVDALGHTTWMLRGLYYGVPSWGEQGWVLQRLKQPGGLVLRYSYESRGNLTKIKDSIGTTPSGADSTRFEWDQSFDQLKKITTPLGRVTQYGISTTNGRRDWEQDPRGAVSRIDYEYHGTYAENVIKVKLPVINGQSAVTKIGYDTTLRNVIADTSALGYVTTRTLDAIGRVTNVTTPIDASPTSASRKIGSTEYSLRGDVIKQVTKHNVGSVDSVLVVSTFNAEGQPLTVSRQSLPNTAGAGVITNAWRYDNIGRTIAAADASGRADSTVYDEAGNAVSSYSRRARVSSGAIAPVTRTFDALNRLDIQTVPGVTYADRTVGIANYAAGPYGYTIPVRADTFTYTSDGQIEYAKNQQGRVLRSYSKQGQLLTETLWIGNVAGTDPLVHSYTTSNRYDRDGHRVRLLPPAWLMTTGHDSIRFVHGDSGLTEVQDVAGNVFKYEFNARGELAKMTRGAVAQTWRYDADGRVLSDSVTHTSSGFPYFPSPQLRDTEFTYDGRGKVLTSLGALALRDSLINTYSPLGALRTSINIQRAYGQTASDSLRYYARDGLASDGLAHVHKDTLNTVFKIWSATSSNQTTFNSWGSTTYLSGTGRESQKNTYQGTRTVEYDSSGNVTLTLLPWAPSINAEDRASYYDAADRLVAADYRLASGGFTLEKRSLDEYRYDALGRRIFVRSQKTCANNGILRSGDCLASLVRRTVWDGAQELAEIQMPGGPFDSALWENDTSLVSVPNGSQNEQLVTMYGRAIYTPGLTIDQPVSVARYHYADRPNAAQPTVDWGNFVLVPIWDVRGAPVFGVFSDGKAFKQLASGGTKCQEGLPVTSQRCAQVGWQWGNTAYNSQLGREVFAWHGSLLQDKRDGAGTFYRRNRSYDPQTGRFTQEDPIGLAGGLNLYGYADGDPVNYSDPFGLCPIEKTGIPCTFVLGGAGAAAGFGAGVAAGTLTTAGTLGLGLPLAGVEVGSLTLVGGAIGATAGLALDVSAAGKRIKRGISRTIEIIGFVVGLINMEPPPKRPDDDEDRPPPAAPTSTKSLFPDESDQRRRY